MDRGKGQAGQDGQKGIGKGLFVRVPFIFGGGYIIRQTEKIFVFL
jgi:hypothetical protein